MNSYPSYKDSGVEWIGEIPSHWKRGKLKHYFDLSSGNNPSDFDKVDGNYPVYGSNGIIGYTNQPDLLHKTILIGRVGSSGELNYNLYPCSVSDNCLIVKLIGSDDLSFVYYLLLKTELKNYTTKTSQPLITGSTIKEIKTLIPPLPEQSQIVSFLDTKTQKIDDLIHKTEKKIELLKEKRTSLINHCVTKGLNPNVEMKDSGVDWIGEIPSGWEVLNGSYIGSYSKGKGIKKDEVVEVGHPCVRYGEIYTKYELKVDSTFSFISNETTTNSVFVKTGTLLLTGSGETKEEIGKCVVYLGDEILWVGGDIIVIKPSEQNDSLFLSYLINSECIRVQREMSGKGEIVVHIYSKNFKEMKYPIPPPHEQTQIVEYLDEQTQKIDSTIEKETQRIELLKEYRQSLISEVVTGKIDVRDWKE